MSTKTRKKKVIYRQEVSGILDYISPSVIEFKPKFIQLGSQVAAVMVITDYPSKAGPAWLSNIITMPGVTSSVHINPTDPYSLIQSINVAIGAYEGRVLQGGQPSEVQRAEKGAKDARELLKKIDQEQQQVSYITVTLLITAKDHDQLNERVKRVEARLAGSGMRGRLPVFKQEEGFKTIGPWGFLEPEIFNQGARNNPTESIAAAYPFVYSGLNDGTGCLLGKDQEGGVALVDFRKREGDRTNSNITIMGKPGMGKSALVKKILTFENTIGRKMLVIDPEREYKELCEELGGSWIDCGGGGRGMINPLQVRSVPLDDEDSEDPLYDSEVIEMGSLALHFQTLRTFFSMYLKDVDKMTMSYLELALEETYNNKNIFWNTDPMSVANEDWPIISDLYDVILSKCEGDKSVGEKELEYWNSLKMLLRSMAMGADSALWNGHTTIKADSDFVVLDINRLLESDEEVLRAQYYLLLGWVWNEASYDREEEVYIAVDEAYLMADPEEPQALKFLRNTSKRIRKYGGGIIVITHNLIDFLDPAIRRYGQALIDNPVYKIIMGQGEKDIQALKELMTLSERESQMLYDAKRGDALFFAGNKRIQIKIELSPFELELFGKGGGS